MKRLLLIILIFPLLAFAKPLQLNDINVVMDNILEHHIEFKKYDRVIISRSFKIYINQFDSYKVYLLEDEVKSYLNLSRRDSNKIVNQVQNGDFSAYIELNNIFQNAILRARDNRDHIIAALMISEIDRQDDKNTSFAKDENDLFQRQKSMVNDYYLNQKKRSKINSNEKKRKTFALLNKRLNRSENRYLFTEKISEADKQDLLATYILKAFAKSLDAHTNFFSEDEAYEMRLALEKEFEGVGLILSESIEGVMVTDLIKNSPAKNSGVIKEGDIITEINGQSIQNVNFDEVMKLMKSKNKSDLVLGFKRVSNGKNSSFWRVKLVKRAISMDEQRVFSSYEPFGDGIIGKLDMKSFYENSAGVTSEKDIKNAIKALRKKGDLKGLILDLRENSGGFLSQAIKVCSIFIKSGVVVISKNSKKEVRYLRTIDGNAYYNRPLIVLTSKLSASASEIVAQALQDYGVALVVGDKSTFGKGSIQYQTVTDKSADFFYKVTVGKYYTVSGKTTQIEGVKADIVVESIYSPYIVGERYLEYPLKADTVKAAYDDNLKDLDSNIKFWFKQNYLPNLQKKVTYWQKMQPTLNENSQKRLSHDNNFQNFLKKQKKIKARIDKKNTNIEYKNFGLEDLQMKESVNILKDMIFIESQRKKDL